MEIPYLLIIIGLLVGTIGTLIGAGGGFILVPLLILFRKDLPPETITAISIAVVAANAMSGSAAYMRARRIDYKAGLIFAMCAIPGSILGALSTKMIARESFDIIFGLLLLALAVFLFFRGGRPKKGRSSSGLIKGEVHQQLTDRSGKVYTYSYNIRNGSVLSLFVGYFSPLFGIGGGIIHVPAMTEWLRFPVHIATATSQFILAIMAIVSVATHIYNDSYNDPEIVEMILLLALGVLPGAQLGAMLSRKINGRMIIRILSVALGVIGIRILTSHLL
ncbi:MAG TPA: sulfite exporter TauE/SafE family protein [Flavobacterium sp.]|jgi:hypothetical protein